MITYYRTSIEISCDRTIASNQGLLCIFLLKLFTEQD
jgi:hypothetical protein